MRDLFGTLADSGPDRKGNRRRINQRIADLLGVSIGDFRTRWRESGIEPRSIRDRMLDTVARLEVCPAAEAIDGAVSESLDLVRR
jgi:hypothetical protein